MPLQDEFTVGSEDWFRQEVSSTSTPLFFSKSKSGDLPVNDFLWKRQIGRNPISQTNGGPQQYSHNQQGFYHAVSGGSMTGPAGNQSLPSLDYFHSLAEMRLRAKVSQATLEGGLILAEYGKTSDFVKGAMVQTAKGLRAVRRGDVKGAWSAFTNNRPPLDFLSDAWLAFTYAFKPLAADVTTTVKLLEEGLVISPLRTVRSSRKQPVAARSVLRYPSSVQGKTLRGDVRFGGGIQYRVNDPFIATLSALGFTDPLSVAWELVPFSFVVDWFIPVNEFLHQFSPPKGVSFVRGWTTVKAIGECSWWTWVKSLPDPPGWHVECSSEELLKSRKKLHDFPTPGLVLPDLSLSKENLISAAALLQQALREKPAPSRRRPKRKVFDVF